MDKRIELERLRSSSTNNTPIDDIFKPAPKKSISYNLDIPTQLGDENLIENFKMRALPYKEKTQISDKLKTILDSPNTFVIIENGNHTITIKDVSVYSPNGIRLYREQINTRSKEPGIIQFLKRYPDLKERIQMANTILYYFETDIIKHYFLEFCTTNNQSASYVDYLSDIAENFHCIRGFQKINSLREAMFSKYYSDSLARIDKNLAVMEEMQLIALWSTQEKEFIKLNEIDPAFLRKTEKEHYTHLVKTISSNWSLLTSDFLQGITAMNIPKHSSSDANDLLGESSFNSIGRIDYACDGKYYFRFANLPIKKSH